MEAINHIVAGWFDPSTSDRSALAALMAFQIVRGQQPRRLMEMASDAHAKTMLGATDEGEIVKQLEARGKPPTEENITAVAEFMKDPDRYEVVSSPGGHLRSMFNVAATYVPRCAAWRSTSLLSSCRIYSRATIPSSTTDDGPIPFVVRGA